MMDLLAGFMVHIGLQEADYMDKGNILTMLFQTMIGQEWEKNITAMRNRIKDMEEKLNKTLSHLEATANTGDRMEPRINELNEAIKKLQEDLDKQKAENRKALMDVRETSSTAKTTALDFKRESKTLKECIDKIKKGVDDVKEMKEMADKHLKTVELYERRLGNIIPEQPATKKETKKDKGKKGDEPSKSGKTTKKRGGRNKEADAAVAEVAKEQHLEEMEEKLKEHWDKKGWE
jgi:peptidoglycan hydrolase CwlO-like protein